MKILSLDIATSLGWAYKDGDRKIKSGTINLKTDEFESYGYRFIKFYNFLEQYKDVDRIVYEKVQFSTTTRATQLYGSWLATLQIFAENHNILYYGYGVTAIKKFATGKGTAKKNDMLAACRDRGYNPKTDDEADAICCLLLALSEIDEGEDRVVRSLQGN